MPDLTSQPRQNREPKAARVERPQRSGEGAVLAHVAQSEAKAQREISEPEQSTLARLLDGARDRLRSGYDWATGPEGISIVASALVHVVLFLGLLVVLLILGWKLDDKPGDQGPINAFFTEKQIEEIPEIMELADLEFDVSSRMIGDLASPDAIATPDQSQLLPEPVDPNLLDPTALLPSTPENLMDLTDTVGGEQGKSWKRAGFAMPADRGKVVTRGSFSVWTVPEDPEPFKNYKIVIQLNRLVPIRNLKQDVTGTVTGTDGYRASIGRVLKGIAFPRQLAIPKARQIVIEIPPAKYELVRDVIEVHSKTLNESQKIEIVF